MDEGFMALRMYLVWIGKITRPKSRWDAHVIFLPRKAETIISQSSANLLYWYQLSRLINVVVFVT